MATRVIIKGFKQFKDQQIKQIVDLADRELKACAEVTAEVMKTYIRASIERSGSQGNLANQIFSSKLTLGYGVGDIDNLNIKAPYWAWINYGIAGTGRRIPPSTSENPAIEGHFDAPSQGRFQKGQPKFPIFPQKAISPHLYIERTVQQITNIVNNVLRQFKRL